MQQATKRAIRITKQVFEARTQWNKPNDSDWLKHKISTFYQTEKMMEECWLSILN